MISMLHALRSREAGIALALLAVLAAPAGPVRAEDAAGTKIPAQADASGAAPAAPPPAAGSIIPKPGAPDPQPFTLEDRYLDAARRGDLDAIKLCLDKGVDVNRHDELNRSALALAVRDGRDLEIAKFLKERGLAIDEADTAGRTPLHEASGNGDVRIVEWLLQGGAKVGTKDMQGRQPLHNAVYGGSKEIVEKLLAAGADVNAADQFGDTPLIGACNKGLNELAKLLVEKGADPKKTDQEGRTAADRAEPTAPFCKTLPSSGKKFAPPEPLEPEAGSEAPAN